MAGISFLRDRSPVTPKITRPHGPAIRGSRLSRGSRSGLVHDIDAGMGRSLLLRVAVALVGAQPCSYPAAHPRPTFWLLRRVQLTLDRLQQLGPGLLELVDALVLQHQEHVGQ